MFETLKNAFKNKDVRRKILITLALLFIYRLGCWVPIPGIDAIYYADQLKASGGNVDGLLGLLNGITGSALQNGALFAIGITPYINASIILQLLTVAIPRLQEWQKQGDDGKKKITQVTRYITLALAAAQAVAVTVSYARANALSNTVFGPMTQSWVIGIFVAVIMIMGSMLTMWLGERITDYGIGNGISLLIFIGIIATAAHSIVANITSAVGGDEMAIWQLIGFVIMVVAVFMLIVFIDGAERRVPVQYAKQIKGRKQYGGQSTFIPIKVNASGVMPIIFATALITFPQMIAQLVAPDSGFYIWWATWLGAGSIYPFYYILVALLILGFSYFYAGIEFNPEDISRNIQQYGGFINGIRPGRPTTEYLSRISKRLTLFGAIFLAFIALVPSVIFAAVLGNTSSLINAFSATGMLIVVSVALEFEKQLQSQLMMKQYKGFLK
ncbi:MAG: preprotein translocase subunit SecY [Clostridiales bacterium]|nr:preprotein translocase subunit SecY [Clostridiales bacterium]